MGDGTQVVVRQRGVCVRGERSGENLNLLGADRQARRRTVAAKPLEVRGARRQACVQVERGDRAARSLPLLVGAGDQDNGPVVALDEARGDDADHALVPALARDHVAAAAAAALRPRLHFGDCLAQDPLLDRLALPVQPFELLGEALRLALVLGQEQRERRLRTTQTSRGVDPRREPEADRRFVDRGRVDARDAHQGAQPELLRLPEPAQPKERECAVLVDERHDVGDGRERDHVEVPVAERMVLAEERLCELPDHPCAAQTGERIIALERRDDRTRGELLGGR